MKVAETLSVEATRTGGRVVDCSGLENLTGDSSETAELAVIRPSPPAQDATFAPCSEAGDGACVGTAPDLCVCKLMGALAGLIVAVQWEVSAIRDGVDVEKRLGILEKGATQALAVLVRNGGGL